MGVWSAIAEGVTKGAKFVSDHRETIKEAATAAQKTASVVSDMAQKRKASSSEKEYSSAIEEENIRLKTAIQELAEGIAALEELYEKKIKELESRIGSTHEELVQVKEQQEEYQKKASFRFRLACICGGVGVLISIILSVIF